MKCSDGVHTETQTQNEETSSYFQMKCSDKLSDIPPSPQFQMKCSDEVHTETQILNEEMSLYFQMKCPDKVSDIPPSIEHRYLEDHYTA